jgi:drug/metabolite transporter (DMT)-like permease
MTQPERKRSLIADAGLLYAAAIWGSTFFIVKAALADIDPVVLVAYRFGLAALILGGYLVVSRRALWRNLREGVILGVMLWLIYAPQTIGLRFTTASNSGLITGLFVVFVPLLALLFFRKKIRPLELVAVGLSLIGLWLLTGGIRGMNLGDAITLITAVAYALHVLYADRFVKAGFDPYTLCFQQFVVVSLLSFIAAILFRLPFSAGSANTIGIVVFLTLFPTISAFVIQLVAQRHTAAIRVSLIFALEPVFAAIFAWTLGGEQFIAERAIGGLLIFSAMITAELAPRLSRQQTT